MNPRARRSSSHRLDGERRQVRHHQRLRCHAEHVVGGPLPRTWFLLDRNGGHFGTSKRADYYASELKIPKGYAPFFGVTLGFSSSAGVEAPTRREGVVTVL